MRCAIVSPGSAAVYGLFGVECLEKPQASNCRRPTRREPVGHPVQALTQDVIPEASLTRYEPPSFVEVEVCFSQQPSQQGGSYGWDGSVQVMIYGSSKTWQSKSLYALCSVHTQTMGSVEEKVLKGRALKKPEGFWKACFLQFLPICLSLC